jgi:hypothetical protein
METLDKEVAQEETQLPKARMVRQYCGKPRARKIGQAVAVFQEPALCAETTGTSNGKHQSLAHKRQDPAISHTSDPCYRY